MNGVSNTSLLELGAHSKSSQICIALFTIYGGSEICECAGECTLKDAEQNSYKKPVITLIFKL